MRCLPDRAALPVRGTVPVAVLVLLALAALALAFPVARAVAAQADDQVALIESFMSGRRVEQGMAVAVSVDGAEADVLCYGYADADGTAEVDAGTAFEWGRCSDLVVWTCVMQLVEAGSLSLTDAVADHLSEGVELPEGYESLTLMDLMNHATGLDVAMLGTRSSIADGETSVLPAFALFGVEGAFEPGELVAYSPYDALLAAAVVEATVQEDFVSYAQESVLDRLGMDGTTLMVGGSPERLARVGDASAATLAAGHTSSGATSTTQSASGSVFSCYGPVGDLLALANGVMCRGDAWAFEDAATADELLSATRDYPGLGIPRIAHGLFALPFTDGVFGISASVTAGYSASVYMDVEMGLAVAVLVGQADRADLVQGIPRTLAGRRDGLPEGISASAGDWTGVYQDASSPNHGPAKLLTALQRVHVGVDDEGKLLFNGLKTTLLGGGVYTVGTTEDQDAYRFHVSLDRGAEFSRVTSDSYAVPVATLAVEGVLLGGLACAWLASAGYLVAGARAWVVARLHRRRAHLQPALLLLAGMTCVSGALAVAAALRLAEGMAPAALGAVLAAQGVYAACAALDVAWVAATRLRRTAGWTRRQHLAGLVVCMAAVAMVLNLLYWEML